MMTAESSSKIMPVVSVPATPLAHTSWTNMPGLLEPPKPPYPLSMKTKNDEKIIGTAEKFGLVTKSFIGATMPQILASSALLSFVWITAYLFFFSILTTQALLTFKDYNSHPVNVEVTIDTTSNFLDFPAVTLCNNNIVKKTYISRIPRYKELASLSDFVYQQVLPEANRDYQELLNLGLHECRSSQKWIPGSWICNNRSDCSDATDEVGYDCRDYQRLNYSENCLSGYVQCPNELTCAVECDGIKDCVVEPGHDESEEIGCISSTGTDVFIATTIPTELTSPNYPQNYMNNLHKTYIIKAPQDHVIKITFEHFNIEYGTEDCLFDALTLFDDGFAFVFNKSIYFCGSLCEFGAIVTTSEKLEINFWSDGSATRSGWSLKYQAIPASEVNQAEQSKEVTVSDQCDDRNSQFEFYGFYNDFQDYGYYRSLYQNYSSNSRLYQDYGSYSSSYQGSDYDDMNDDFWDTFYSEGGTYEFSQFKDIERYDWYSVYNNSKMPDFSDFRKFIKFKQEELIGNGHQKEDFIVQCVFDGQICGIDWFWKFQHVSFGNCFTFNSVVDAQGDMENVKHPRSTTKTGSENGLALSLFLENEEYLGIIGHYSGVRVVLHNADEYPPLLTKGIEINSGTATTVRIRQETIFRESDPFSDCAEKWPEFLELNENYRKYRYTLEFCRYLCKQKTLAEVCGCTDTFDWNFSDNDYVLERARQDCDVWNSTEYVCLISVYEEYDKGIRSCECPNPCSDKIFRAFASSASWPSTEYTAHFISVLKNSNSSKVKKFISSTLSESHNNPYPKETLHQSIKNNFARVKINFETLVFQKIKESPKYNLSTLFGTVGGNLGLWLGWSILSIMEFIQWIAMVIGLFIMDRRKQTSNVGNNGNQIHNPNPYL